MKKQLFIGSVVASALLIYYFTAFNNAVEKQPDLPLPLSLSEITNTTTSQWVSSDLVPGAADQQSLFNTEKKPEIFWINTHRPQEIEGAYGTKILFPTDAFIHSNGKEPGKKIRIELEEYYNLPDMLMAKLSTKSGNKMLETAGMIKITAFDGDAELKLKSDAQYTIYFPRNQNTKDDFKLFYGEWKSEQLDWRLAEQPSGIMRRTFQNEDTGEKIETLSMLNNGVEPERLSPRRTSLLADDESCFINIASSKLRTGTAVREMDYYQWKLQDGQTLNQWFVSNFNPDLQMIEDFCILGYRPEITFHLTKDGKIDSYYISKSALPTYDRLLAGFMMNVPNIELAELMTTYKSDNACILTFGSRAGSNQQKFVAQFKSKYKTEKEEDFLSNVEKSDMEYYVFNSTELGWINCDRFDTGSEELVSVSIETDDTKSCHVSMVFDDLNSILAGVVEGNKIMFHDVPSNRQVRIISIKNNGTQPLLCVTHHNTAKPLARLEAYKPFSLKELDKTLRKSSPTL